MSDTTKTEPQSDKDKAGGKTIRQKLKGLKHKEIILAVIAVGVMLIIYFSTLGNPDTKTGEQQLTSDYCADMQARLETAVNSMSGGAESKVIINWESGVEAVIAYVTNENQNSTSQSPQVVQGGPIVLKEVYPKALGVVVVCPSGDNIRLQIEIKDMVSTLLEIAPDKIAVFKTNK